MAYSGVEYSDSACECWWPMDIYTGFSSYTAAIILRYVLVFSPWKCIFCRFLSVELWIGRICYLLLA